MNSILALTCAGGFVYYFFGMKRKWGETKAHHKPMLAGGCAIGATLFAGISQYWWVKLPVLVLSVLVWWLTTSTIHEAKRRGVVLRADLYNISFMIRVAAMSAALLMVVQLL